MLRFKITANEKTQKAKIDVSPNISATSEMILNAMIDSPEVLDVIILAINKYKNLERSYEV